MFTHLLFEQYCAGDLELHVIFDTYRCPKDILDYVNFDRIGIEIH